MTDKNSNRISLIVAVLAIVLILGGVYMLQKSFTSSSSSAQAKSTVAKNATVKTSTITPTSSTPTTPSTTGSTTGSASGTTTTTTQSTTSSPISATIRSTTTSSASTTPATTTQTVPTTQVNSTTPTKTTAPANTPLSANQLTAKYIGNNTFEIVSCGKTGTNFCQSPYKVYINNQVANNVGPLSNDKTYKFDATWNEDKNGILFSNIQSIVEVK
jgi:cytoskeletal protein RodZ